MPSQYALVEVTVQVHHRFILSQYKFYRALLLLAWRFEIRIEKAENHSLSLFGKSWVFLSDMKANSLHLSRCWRSNLVTWPNLDQRFTSLMPALCRSCGYQYIYKFAYQGYVQSGLLFVERCETESRSAQQVLSCSHWHCYHASVR